MKFANVQVFNNADASTDQDGLAIDAEFMVQASMWGFIAGEEDLPHGVIKFQASNQTDENIRSTGTQEWADIPGATLTISSGAGNQEDGFYLIPAFNICYKNIRLVWIANGGATDVTLVCWVKGNYF